MDEVLWRKFTVKYNSSKEGFDLNHWKQASDKFKILNKDTEITHNHWKKSGNHGNFGNFCSTKKCILYMHCFMERNPHLLEVVLFQLPAGAFSESTSKPPPTSAPPTAGRKKKRDSPAFSNVKDDA
eukprot:3625666-Ditylum_brightwellii.AAC.1